MNKQEQTQGFDSLIEAISDRVAEKVCKRMEEKAQKNDDGELMTRDETLEYLHITDGTLWRWVKLGILQTAGKIGSRVYYRKSDVEKALEYSKNCKN